jgi:hypothetical protein
LSLVDAFNEHHVSKDDEEGVIGVIYMFVKRRQTDSNEESNVATK